MSSILKNFKSNYLMNFVTPLLFLLCYTFLLSHFHGYFSPYGDEKGYIGTATSAIVSYSPIFSFLAKNFYYHLDGIQSIFIFNEVIYFFTALLVARLFLTQSKFIYGAFLFLQFFNIFSYFYISVALTEIFNLFVFVICMKTYSIFENKSDGQSQIHLFFQIMCCSILLSILSLTRNANFVFLLFLTFFTVIFPKSNKKMLTILVIPLIFSSIYNYHLQTINNDTGVNLHRFAIIACQNNQSFQCSDKIFKSGHSNRILNFYEKNHTLAGLPSTLFASAYSPDFSQEMRAVYFRILFYNPGKFFHAVWINYKNEVKNTELSPYPEDINNSLLATQPISFLAKISVLLSKIAAIAAPLLILIYLYFGFRTKLDAIAIFSLSWVSFELFTSNAMFADLFYSDGSRMRFHYEVPVYILLALLFPLLKKIREQQ